MRWLACVWCAASCAGEPGDALEPPLDAYAEAMTALHPDGYWRLDTDAIASGQYHGAPRLGDPGVDGTSVHFDGNAQYGELADRDAFSLTRVWDDFARTTVVGWGGPWSGRGRVVDGIAWLDGEQALGLPLASGNVQVMTAGPVAIVAERVGDSHVRAELRPTGLYLVATVNGVDEELSSQALDVHGWWYLRFEFDHGSLSARAWSADAEEPRTWLVASAVAGEGAIALRGSTYVRAFRAQSLGFSIHAAIRLDSTPTSDVTQILGKGNHAGFFSDADQEFHLRILRDDAGLHLKGYMFNHDGGYGAGQTFEIEPARWYDVVLEFDPGDHLDATAGVRMFVDGVALPDDIGSRYRSRPCDADHTVCWSIDPTNGRAPLRIGTSDGSSFFAGNIDELAVFDRLLQADEIDALRAQASPL